MNYTELKLSDRTVNVRTEAGHFGWAATEENYSGPGDSIRMAISFKSKEHALSQLTEQLEEAIAEDRI